MMIELPIKTTKHFRERMKLFGLYPYDLLWMLPLSIPEKKPKTGREKYSFAAKHIRYGTMIFAYIETIDKSELQLGNMILMLSVFDQKMYLPADLQ